MIRKAQRHPDAESLYVEEIDVGEEQPRQVCVGGYVEVPLYGDKGTWISIWPCDLHMTM